MMSKFPANEDSETPDGKDDVLYEEPSHCEAALIWMRKELNQNG